MRRLQNHSTVSGKVDGNDPWRTPVGKPQTALVPPRLLTKGAIPVIKTWSSGCEDSLDGVTPSSVSPAFDEDLAPPRLRGQAALHGLDRRWHATGVGLPSVAHAAWSRCRSVRLSDFDDGREFRAPGDRSEGPPAPARALPTWNRRALAADDPSARYDGPIQHQPNPPLGPLSPDPGSTLRPVIRRRTDSQTRRFRPQSDLDQEGPELRDCVAAATSVLR
jgi:hypothetical protein